MWRRRRGWIGENGEREHVYDLGIMGDLLESFVGISSAHIVKYHQTPAIFSALLCWRWRTSPKCRRAVRPRSRRPRSPLALLRLRKRRDVSPPQRHPTSFLRFPSRARRTAPPSNPLRNRLFLSRSSFQRRRRVPGRLPRVVGLRSEERPPPRRRFSIGR